jgi:4-hydroxy-3-methylbut-2-en-1-yl diphosphate reductase
LPRGLLVAAPTALEVWLISSGAPGVRVRKTGVGPRRSRAAASTLREEALGALLIMGFGGGLDPGSAAGEVVVADELYGPDGARISCPGAEALAQVLRAGGLSARPGGVVSASRPAVGRARECLRERGAVWPARAAGARLLGVVRVLLDTPGRELWHPWLTLTGLVRASAALRRAAATLCARLQSNAETGLPR